MGMMVESVGCLIYVAGAVLVVLLALYAVQMKKTWRVMPLVSTSELH